MSKLTLLGILISLWLIAGAAILAAPAAAQGGRPVLVLTADGALTVAMREYLLRGLRLAERQGAEAIVLQLDTPGGSVDLMNEMVEAIRASRVPIVVYVTPRGAMAGSAGTLITLAGHAAAMAPETAIGAASPVGGQGEDLGETMAAKEKNILKATVRALAERRGPEAVRLAERTIDEAHAVSASEARASGLVDFIAVDLVDLLRQLDGFSVETVEGPRLLQTAFSQAQPVDPSPTEILLGVLTNPTLLFFLLIIGVQSVLIEISSPGGWVAGFIGAVTLALAGYGMGLLPVNWFGVIFLVIAFVLFILDIKAATHGALTLAGVGSLIAGGMVLFNSPSAPQFQRVPIPAIIGASVVCGIVFFGAMVFGVRAQKTPLSMGMESLIGRTGTARTDLAPGGQVQLGGEQWSAELAPGAERIGREQRIEVVGVRGLRLLVRKAPDES